MSDDVIERVTKPELLPEGAAYSLVYAFDADGEPVHPRDERATTLQIEHYDSDDELMGRESGTFGG